MSESDPAVSSSSRIAEIRQAWDEIATAEQACFGDSLTFHTVRPILERFRDDVIRKVTKASRDLADFGQQTGASPWT